MAELTREAFEQALSRLVTKEDLKAFATKEDLKGLAKKQDLKDQTDAIGRMINIAFQDHQENYLEERFERLSVQISLTRELHTLRNDFDRLKQEVEAMKAGGYPPAAA